MAMESSWPDKKELESLRLDTLGNSWRKALQEEFGNNDYTGLAQFVASERKQYPVYPAEVDVFRWANLCPVDKVKVVIIGQDPYTGDGKADGLCFSVKTPRFHLQKKTPIFPSSLENIFKALENDPGVVFKMPDHGNLEGWAQQGVLLLNTVLTVRGGLNKDHANSHKGQGWEKLTDAVIKYISSSQKNVVFMLWGTEAQKKAMHIDKSKHLVLYAPHPTSRGDSLESFKGCKHFSQANDFLEKKRLGKINWNAL